MIDLDDILPHLLHQFDAESDLVKAVGELSEAFTTDRAKLSRYLSDPRLVSAYTAFYAATNIPKLEAAFQWFDPALVESWKGWQLIDVGAGPGTFSLAWRAWGGTRLPLLLESSALMRQQAQKLFTGLFGAAPYFDGKQLGEGPRLMLFGHSFNEMGEARALELIREFGPQVILFIEPGTKDVFSQLLPVRAKLLQQGHRVLFPCTGPAACPWQGSGKDWCHQFLHVCQAPGVERLTQLARLDRKLLPIICHLYHREAHPGPLPARLIRVHAETKFSFEWEVCRESQGRLATERVQIMKKDYSSEERKLLSGILAGSAVWVEEERRAGEVVRVKLSARVLSGKN